MKKEIPEQPNALAGAPYGHEIDHTIDVRYAPNARSAFNRFIKKWCGKYYGHLIDSDDNDGQFVRDHIIQSNRQAVVVALAELKSELYTDAGVMDIDDVEAYIDRRIVMLNNA